MIRDITLEDEEFFQELGLLINDNFNIVYKLSEELNKPTSVIKVYDDGEIKGFIQAEVLGEETNVINIVVKEKYRRQHIAEQLLEDMFLNTKSNVFILEVKIDNKPAINLYKKHGFEEKGIRKGYYNGFDAITMVKRI